MNTTYSASTDTTARALLRAGLWELALDGGSLAVRAEILTDYFWWRQERATEAETAVAALAERDALRARFCGAQLAYTRVVFGIDPRPDDAERARTGFSSAATDPRLANWATFWQGVVADNVDDQPARAADHYAGALEGALEQDDLMLESYAIRHLGSQALDRGDLSGLELLRRSYHLRAALGARPHTAAAAATLASALPPGAESDQLRKIAARTARDLRLTWLAKSLSER